LNNFRPTNQSCTGTNQDRGFGLFDTLVFNRFSWLRGSYQKPESRHQSLVSRTVLPKCLAVSWLEAGEIVRPRHKPNGRNLPLAIDFK